MAIAIDEANALRVQRLIRLGYGSFAALHNAAAESAEAVALLTIDDGLLDRAARQ